MGIQSKPNLGLLIEVLSHVEQAHAVPKIPGEVKVGCMCCATEGGMMHSIPRTAGLTRKPHYCKLPHYTLSKGAKKTKKDKFDLENLSYGSIKQSTCT